ncbi:MAG: hypothetical protein K6B38_13235 [Ruminococcus sp.]|nr:hypothetical protein [Ruminococcus sp.]
MTKKLFSILTVVAISLCTVSSTYSDNMTVLAKEAQEITSKRTAYSKVFDNGNGTYTAYSNAAPIHYITNDGWKEIDNTLSEESEDYFQNKENSFKVLIPKKFSLDNKKQVPILLKNDKLDMSISLNELVIPDISTDTTGDSYAEINNDVYDVSDESDFPSALEDAFKKTSSITVYKEVAKDLDFSISVHNSSITESLIVNAKEYVPETLRYSISVANDVTLEKGDTNELIFMRDNEIVMTLPPFVLEDSSEDRNIINVNYDIIDTEEGYELILYPLSSINEIGNLIAPMSIGTEFEFDRPNMTNFNSESYPTLVYGGSNIKIGNETGNGYHTLAALTEDFSLYDNYTTILDATYYIYVTNINNSGIHTITSFSNNTYVSYKNWNNTTPIGSNYTNISSVAPALGWTGINMTSLMSAWVNYHNTNSVVGLANNGFTLALEGANATVIANSSSATTKTPVFRVNFAVNINNYTLEYAPLKYDNINPASSVYSKIYNFQNRMNCYAYALQMYCYNTSTYNQLNPGEIGLSQQIANQQFTDITTFGALKNAYNNWLQYSSLHNNCTLESFITEQMKKDAQAMGCSVTKLSFSSTTGLNNYVNNSFNESNGRVIALASTTGWTGNAKIHYYLRNGNGTCDNPNHGSKCSVWSDKFDYLSVSGGSTNCDQNICLEINDTSSNHYCGSPTFYFITKEANVYNSWYYFNHNDNNTGTQFVYNT